ncbi:CRISPR-associated protein Cas4 [Paludisphaera rhizosphaerae]|uniref:CRISPR-associated protein Cas4 n=1 Tax=Paludisphaera rhizosphaerae TaxID=2711216 RepID=UPI0013ECE038|nr:CRISPR-associated protein Cas4 [Paludisphaera rhizosphaerae]
MTEKLFLVAALLGLLGLVVVVIAWARRRVQGFGSGRTVALDDVTLYSKRYGLVGRPDRIVKEGDDVVPEEWKSSRQVSHGHRLQLATYFILIEENYGRRPPYGFVVLGDGSRVRVENTEELCSEVVEIAERIREHRARMAEEIPVQQPAWKCERCGQRENCGQASG